MDLDRNSYFIIILFYSILHFSALIQGYYTKTTTYGSR